MSEIEPYYADEQVTLYCADFREILPQVLADVLPFGEAS